MIAPEELYRTLHRRPFQPFRLHLEDGTRHDIHFPKINVVGTTFFVVGVPVPDDPDPVAVTSFDVPLTAIDRLEVLTEPLSPAVG